MKRLVYILFICFLFVNSSRCYSQQKTLQEHKISFNYLRSKLATLAKELKEEIPNSSDIIYMNNLWNSCMLTISQIDAYLAMLGILATSKEEVISLESKEYLLAWLERMNATNQNNLYVLNNPPQNLEEKTYQYIEKIKSIFIDYKELIEKEISVLNPNKDKE